MKQDLSVDTRNKLYLRGFQVFITICWTALRVTLWPICVTLKFILWQKV